MDHCADHSGAKRYSWEIWLRAPAHDRPLLAPDGMTAAEQIFFLGAPLAHVVEFERQLRTRRTPGPRLGARSLGGIAIRARGAPLAA